MLDKSAFYRSVECRFIQQVAKEMVGRPWRAIHFKEGDGGRMDIGRATTRANTVQIKSADGRPQGPTPPHPLPARPYYTTNLLVKPVYRRGRGGCGCGDGALVAARGWGTPS